VADVQEAAEEFGPTRRTIEARRGRRITMGARSKSARRSVEPAGEGDVYFTKVLKFTTTVMLRSGNGRSYTLISKFLLWL
jgi:hypothetical protein